MTHSPKTHSTPVTGWSLTAAWAVLGFFALAALTGVVGCKGDVDTTAAYPDAAVSAELALLDAETPAPTGPSAAQSDPDARIEGEVLDFDPSLPALGALPSAAGTLALEDIPVEEKDPLVLDHPADPEVDHLARGEEALSRNDPAEALRQFQMAVFDLGSYDAYLGVGRAARASGDRSLAIEAFEAAADTDRDQAEPLVLAARLALGQENIARGLALVDRAIAREPRRPEAHNVRGRLWMAREQYHQALISFERAIDLDPAYVWAYNNAGYIHLLTGEYEDAVDHLEVATTLEPVKAYMWNNLGLAYEKLGRVNEARRAFNEALSMKPGYVNAHINLSRVRTRLAMAASASEAATEAGETSSDF